MPYSNIRFKDNEKITPLKENILVSDMKFGERKTKTGIILPGDDGVERGIRPRWAKVIAVGPDQKDVKEGQWVLVSHGRWTRGFGYVVNGEETTVRMADPKEILGVQDEEPLDEFVPYTDPNTARF